MPEPPCDGLSLEELRERQTPYANQLATLAMQMSEEGLVPTGFVTFVHHVNAQPAVAVLVISDPDILAEILDGKPYTLSVAGCMERETPPLGL